MDEDILSALMVQLSTAVPELKHINLWDNQVENEAHENPFLRPAVFIDFEQVDWTDVSRGPQTGVLRVSFHIVQESLAEMYAGSSDQEKALQVFCLPKKVHNALQGFSGDWFAPLSRVSTKRDKSIADQIIFIATYNSTITDNSGAQDQNYVDGTTVNIGMGQPGAVPAPEQPSGDFIIPL